MIVVIVTSGACNITARLAQPVERKALNLVVVGSSPTVGALPIDLREISSSFVRIVHDSLEYPDGES
jgi:hypothetical protein